MNRKHLQSISGLAALAAASGLSAKSALPTAKFDLICRLHVRFVRELHPENHDVWMMPTDSSKGITRFSVDLDAGRIRDVTTTDFCAKNPCNSLAMTKDMRIRHYDSQYVYVLADKVQKWSIRRKDGWFESHHVVSPYMAELVTGKCRPAPFSGRG